MKSFWQPNRIDGYAVIIILVCSPIFAIMQNYQEPAMFGSVLRAILVSFFLGACFVFPLSLYLLVKYGRLLFTKQTSY